MERQLSVEIGRQFRVYFPRYVYQAGKLELVIKYPYSKKTVLESKGGTDVRKLQIRKRMIVTRIMIPNCL